MLLKNYEKLRKSCASVLSKFNHFIKISNEHLVLKTPIQIKT